MFLNSHDIEYVNIKQRKYRNVKLGLFSNGKNVAIQVKYSTLGQDKIYGQFYDKDFLSSSRVKFYPKELKMVYIIPYFQDQLTKRINRNVKANIVFTPHGWSKLMDYVMSRI